MDRARRSITTFGGSWGCQEGRFGVSSGRDNGTKRRRRPRWCDGSEPDSWRDARTTTGRRWRERLESYSTRLFGVPWRDLDRAARDAVRAAASLAMAEDEYLASGRRPTRADVSRQQLLSGFAARLLESGGPEHEWARLLRGGPGQERTP